MRNWERKIEVAANVAIIIVAVAISVVLVKIYFANANDSRPERIAAGSKLILEGLNWQKNERTLLIALQPGCSFCADSAPFYQSLLAKLIPQRKTSVVALVPDDIPNASNYPKELGITVDEIRQTSLTKAKILGTPTLVLVNNTGIVEKVWFGKLSSSQERDVIDYLNH